MKKEPGRLMKSEAFIKDVKHTKRLFNPEEKIAIVSVGLSGDVSIAEICRREGIAQYDTTLEYGFLDEIIIME